MRARLFTIIAVGCLMGPSLCNAADDLPRGRKLAVIVGNNEYRPNQGLETLRQAVNDAHRLSAALRQADFTVIEMTHDVAKEPGKAILAPHADYIRDQIDAIVDAPNLGREDVVLISLHGHGVQFDFEENVSRAGQNEIRRTPRFFFCPADALLRGADGTQVKRANDLTDRNHLLALDELYQKLEGCTAATKLLIVDACRNDPTRSNNERALESVTLPRLPPPPGGIAAFFSCKANQKALEDAELGQGVFTHFLIQGLSGNADQPLEGAPADGVVTLSELTSYVSNNTYSYVLRKYPGVKQSPDIKGEYDPNLSLARIVKQLPAEITSKVTGMKLKLIPAGEFEMGSRLTETELAIKFARWGAQEGGFKNEHPAHRVKISRPFYLGAYEVTVTQFRQFANDADYKTQAEADGKGGWGWEESKFFFEQNRRFNWKDPALDQAGSHPVVNVTWNDAKRYCEWLSRKEGQSYRLPTEAEWEYACKAGTNTLWSNGDNLDGVIGMGNIADQAAKAKKIPHLEFVDANDGFAFTAPVGKFFSNRFGLFDMYGNVAEWCEDVYDANLYGQRSGSTIDPQQTSGSNRRVIRGGSWFDSPQRSRSAARDWLTPDDRSHLVGFRVVRTQ